MMLLAEPAGRLLERAGNRAPRGMTVHDRTRLIGQLHFVSHFFKKKSGFNFGWSRYRSSKAGKLESLLLPSNWSMISLEAG